MTLPDWGSRAVACIASGPSLTLGDCFRVHEAGLVTIVTNSTFRLIPWADALYAFDAKWIRRYYSEARETFAGRIFCPSLNVGDLPGVECAAGANPTFGQSGACAISLAICAGARRIVMLGYDCDASFPTGRKHHHADHPSPLGNCDSIRHWPGQFERLARFAKTKGATVLNASRHSALTCFPRVSLDEALARD